MVFSDRERVKKMQASGKRFGGSERKGKGEGVSSEVAALTQEGSARHKDTAVSEIIGDVKIDLNEGRPKDEQIRPAEQGGQTSDAGVKDDGGKKPKSKKPKTTKPKTTKRDFGDLESKGKDELIIY
jgi:hypothetical protein